jgi:hypothetical protein
VPVIAATVLQILIEEWQAEGNSLPTLSAKTGLPIKALREVAYRADTVDVTTAARIMVVLKEPLRPELARAYRQWRKSQ